MVSPRCSSIMKGDVHDGSKKTGTSSPFSYVAISHPSDWGPSTSRYPSSRNFLPPLRAQGCGRKYPPSRAGNCGVLAAHWLRKPSVLQRAGPPGREQNLRPAHLGQGARASPLQRKRPASTRGSFAFFFCKPSSLSVAIQYLPVWLLHETIFQNSNISSPPQQAPSLEPNRRCCGCRS